MSTRQDEGNSKLYIYENLNQLTDVSFNVTIVLSFGTPKVSMLRWEPPKDKIVRQVWDGLKRTISR